MTHGYKQLHNLAITVVCGSLKSRRARYIVSLLNVILISAQ